VQISETSITVFGQPFAKGSVYAIGLLSVYLSVTLVHCGQAVRWIRMPLSMGVGIGPGHTVLDGDSALQKRGTTLPKFSAHVCCGQTAGWIKMPLGTEVGLGPGDIVLDWYPAPPKRGTASPLFGPCLLWPNGGPSQPVLSCCRIGYGESVRYFGYGSVTSNTAVATTREVQLFNFKIV